MPPLRITSGRGRSSKRCARASSCKRSLPPAAASASCTCQIPATARAPPARAGRKARQAVVVAQATLAPALNASQALRPTATSSAIGFAQRLPLGLFAALLTWVLMLPVGSFGLVQIVATTLRQLAGPAEMVDFVAFYTGSRLLLVDPSQLYDLGAWLQLQTIMHAGVQLPLHFRHPPH